MHLWKLSLVPVMACLIASVADADPQRLLTFADGRPDGGIRQGADTEDGLDSPGDIFVFDQLTFVKCLYAFYKTM